VLDPGLAALSVGKVLEALAGLPAATRLASA
jgi:hypothetical protein